MIPVRRFSPLVGLLLAAFVLATLTVGCSSGTASITISDPWARASSAMASSGAAY
jgi:hypothetical protein